MKFNTLIILSGLFATGLANAECPSSLSKQDIAKCQSLEKSGANYQKWLDQKAVMSGKSTISPITGKDVTSITPAAGKATTPAK